MFYNISQEGGSPTDVIVELQQALYRQNLTIRSKPEMIARVISFTLQVTDEKVNKYILSNVERQYLNSSLSRKITFEPTEFHMAVAHRHCATLQDCIRRGLEGMQVNKKNETVAYAERYSRLAKYFIVSLYDAEPKQCKHCDDFVYGNYLLLFFMFSVSSTIESRLGPFLFKIPAKNDWEISKEKYITRRPCQLWWEI